MYKTMLLFDLLGFYFEMFNLTSNSQFLLSSIKKKKGYLLCSFQVYDREMDYILVLETILKFYFPQCFVEIIGITEEGFLQKLTNNTKSPIIHEYSRSH